MSPLSLSLSLALFRALCLLSLSLQLKLKLIGLFFQLFLSFEIFPKLVKSLENFNRAERKREREGDDASVSSFDFDFGFDCNYNSTHCAGGGGRGGWLAQSTGVLSTLLEYLECNIHRECPLALILVWSDLVWSALAASAAGPIDGNTDPVIALLRSSATAIWVKVVCAQHTHTQRERDTLGESEPISREDQE